MDVSKLTLGERIVLVAGVVLIIDLLLLPWHDIDLGSLGGGSLSGVEAPNAAYGVLAVLGTFVMVGLIVAVKLTTALQAPSWPQILVVAAVVVVLAVVIKFLAEPHALGFGAFLAVLLAGALAFGTYAILKDEGILT